MYVCKFRYVYIYVYVCVCVCVCTYIYMQVMPPCSTILIRGGYYKWQLGGMPSHQTVAFHEVCQCFQSVGTE
jgi:hypothetical protein